MKQKKEVKINKTALSIVKGFSITLFSILVILSPGTFFKFLSQGIIAGFGFIGFWILMPAVALFGIYVAFKKQAKKYKIGLSLAGVFVVIAFASILATNYIIETYGYFTPFGVNTDQNIYLNGLSQDFVDTLTGDTKTVTGYLTMDSSFHYLGQVINHPTSGIASSTFAYNVYLAGGFFGFVLDGIFNSLFRGTLGTTILSICFIAFGVILVFNQQIKMLVNFIRNGRSKVKTPTKVRQFDEDEDYEYQVTDEDREELSYRKNSASSEANKPQPEMNYASFSNMNFSSFNSGNSLQKPTLSFGAVPAPSVKEQAHFEQAPAINEDKEDEIIDAPKSAPKETSLKGARLEAPDSFIPDFISALARHEEEKGKPQEESIYHANEATRVMAKQEEPVEVVVKEEPKIVTPRESYADYLANQPKEVVIKQAEPKPALSKPIIEKPISQEEIKILKPYVLPPVNLLKFHEKEEDRDANTEFCESRVKDMNTIFDALNIGAKVVSYTVGPSVTQYDLLMNSDRSISSVDRFIPDLQVRLGGIPIRFEKLVIGKATSGLEMENKVRTTVGLRECVDKLDPLDNGSARQIIFGKGIDGSVVKADLTKFPHMLVAGTTGSGKSIFIHSTLVTLLLRNTPEQLKLLLIDPKRVELNYYRNIPHLICPNISESKKALVALRKLVDEMERRYTLFSDNMVNEIKNFNKVAEQRGLKKLPYILVVVDEYADLNDECKEIREPVSRLAQKARSAGIHLIIATQRPSVNVIDGVIKANISTRVALSVSSQEDSRVIIGEGGAEKLLGNGDLLIDSPLISRTYKPRVQGCFVEEDEIIAVTDYIRGLRGPEYDPYFLNLEEAEPEPDNDQFDDSEPTKVSREIQEEELYDIIKEDLMTKEYCSISYIQRSYGVGFPKAGRLFARLQKEGVVAKSGDSSRGCKVLIKASLNNESMGSIEQSTLVVSEDEE